eukprot:3884685-Prymnesium_polylepis.2
MPKTQKRRPTTRSYLVLTGWAERGAGRIDQHIARGSAPVWDGVASLAATTHVHGFGKDHRLGHAIAPLGVFGSGGGLGSGHGGRPGLGGGLGGAAGQQGCKHIRAEPRCVRDGTHQVREAV